MYVLRLLRFGDDFDEKYERSVRDYTTHRISLTEILQTKWKSTNLYEEDFGKIMFVIVILIFVINVSEEYVHFYHCNDN